MIADFESNLNNLGGSIFCYGAVKDSSFNEKNKYDGKRSYKLVFSKDVIWDDTEYSDIVDHRITGSGMKRIEKSHETGRYKRLKWAVCTIDMGPISDPAAVPAVIEPFDFTKYRYLVFWVKGRRGGERFKIYFRDKHAKTYEPQLKVKPKVRVTKEWRSVKVDLRKFRLRGNVDLKNIIQIGIGFGEPDNGRMGNVLYIDNIILVK